MFSFPAMHFSSPGTPPPSSNVVSVQQVEITIASGSTSNTASISSVSTTRSVCFLNGWKTGNTNDNFHQQFPIVELTDATTVTAKRGASGGGSLIVNATIVEFSSSLVSSVQSGEISITSTNTSNTATISSVTASRACVILRGSNVTTDVNQQNSFCEVKLTNSTTVTANRNNTTSATVSCAYTVIEFVSGTIQSVQDVDSTSNPSAADTDATISAVTTANCLVLWRGAQNTIATFFGQNTIFRVALTSSTNVRFTKNGTNSGARSLRATVVEFTSGILGSRQAGNIAIASSSTSNTATISAVNTNKTLVNYQYFDTSNTTSSVQSSNFCNAVLTNSTTVTGSRVDSSGTVTLAYEAIEFI